MYKSSKITFLVCGFVLALDLRSSKAQPDYEEFEDYNQQEEELRSFEKCPENKALMDKHDVQLKFYHNETGRCYTAGEKGPCPPYMLWWQSTPGSEFGECGCYSDLLYLERINRPIARSRDNNWCYPLYTKAYCNQGEWFVVNKKWEGECVPNPCVSRGDASQIAFTNRLRLGNWKPENGEDPQFAKCLYDEKDPIDKPTWYARSGRCYSTYTQGHCEKGEIAKFQSAIPSLLPDCEKYIIKYDEVYCQQHHPFRNCCGQAGGGFIRTNQPRCLRWTRLHGTDCVPNENVEIDEY